MKRAIAIRHVAFEDLGSFANVLSERGYGISYLEASCDDLTQLMAQQPDLLVVLGGPIGAYDKEDYPFLTTELQILQERLAADLPTLGICLGAQLMARALNAPVYPGQHKEIGWAPITLTEAGARSPLSHLVAGQTPVFHWHGDTFDLPVGAVHLASSPLYPNQAFAWKQCGLALQFHPEVTASGLESWFVGHACEIHAVPNLSVLSLRQDTACYGQTSAKQAVEFWRSWLDAIAIV